MLKLGFFITLLGLTTTGEASPIISGCARFTVITESLIRMELSVNCSRIFEERPSMIMNQRPFPAPPPFTVSRYRTSVVIKTARLTLQYTDQSNATKFTPATLNVTFDIAGKQSTWQPGMRDDANLQGTNTALDCYDEPSKCVAGYRSSIGPVTLTERRTTHSHFFLNPKSCIPIRSHRVC